MGAFFSQVFSLLTSPQGNLIYQLVLAFSIAGALQPAYVQWQSSRSRPSLRIWLGMAALLGAVLALFLLGALAWRGIFDAALILPPLDRWLVVIALVAAIWLWAFPQPSRQADMGAGLVAALATAAAVANLLTRGVVGTNTGFNLTLSDMLWQAASIGLILVGAGILLIRRTEGFVAGLAFLGLAFVGHVAHLLVWEPGSYAGVLRLAYMAAFPLLLTLAQRHLLVSAGAAGGAGARQRGVGLRRYGADEKTAQALIQLTKPTGGPEDVVKSVARAVTNVMLADLGFLASVSEDKSKLLLSGGYDLIREDYLQGAEIETASVPRLSNALQRGRPLRLSASGTSEDLTALAKVLDLSNSGHLLGAPLASKEGQPARGLVLLSPYSQRLWSTEDQDYLVRLADGLGPLLERLETAPVSQGVQSDRALEYANTRLKELESRNDELASQLEAMAAQQDRQGAAAAETDSLRSANEQSRQKLQQLQAELEASRNDRRLTEAQLEEQLKGALADMAHLQNQLAVANQKAVELEAAGGTERRKKEQAEVIASLSQELRQPMSSIIGYTDLLLGESVGILGALQRKFVERIRASTERMGGLVDDMIQLNTLEVGLSELKPEAMDLNLIIDNALAYTSSQVREKKISIHLDLPKKMAAVSADRDALQQILIHLLQNAGAATPMEGTISIKVQNTTDEGQKFVMIQVTDSGGGILAEDLPRVFTRLYRADNVLIQGVGDTGVGLSIAKTLTEAQHGRIWVESQPGTGATFNVLLPAVASAFDLRPSTEAG
jgi:signal transduction histidine kinase